MRQHHRNLMRFSRACLAHALKGHYREDRYPTILIPAELHVADEVWRLQESSQVSHREPRTRVCVDGAEELVRWNIVHVHVPQCSANKQERSGE